MAYYNSRSGASFDDPNRYYHQVPTFLYVLTLIIAALIVIPSMIYFKIRWGWFLLLFPVVAGILQALLVTENKTTQRVFKSIMALFGLVVGSFVGYILGGIPVALFLGFGIAAFFYSFMGNDYRRKKEDREYGDHVRVERKKRQIQERFQGRRNY